MSAGQQARNRAQRLGVQSHVDETLSKLGVQQETRRELLLGHNAGVAISIITVPSVITGSLAIAWNNGGPVSVIYGWVAAALLALLIGLSMAEITSGLPSAGGPFFWASWLAGEHGPLASWLTGWCNLCGQLAVTAGIGATFMNIAAVMFLLGVGRQLSAYEQLLIYGGVLVVSGLLNSMSSEFLAKVTAVSVMWHKVVMITMTVLVPMIAPYYQSASFVFGKFNGVLSSQSGITSNPYLFIQGLLFGSWCLTEETAGAGASVPRAIIFAVVSTAVLGLLELVSILFSIQDPSNLATGAAGGNIAAQIYDDVFRARFNSGAGAHFCLAANLLACLFATLCSVTANSRMIWAFAREGAVPCHRYFRVISPATKTPRRTVWLSVCAAFILGTPLLKSAAIFNSVISVASTALAVSYGIPILCRVTLGRHRFCKGEFHMGRFSIPVSWAAVIGICFNTVIFSLPPVFPISAANFNYAPAQLGGILLVALAAWYCPGYGARLWYQGPRHSWEERQYHMM